MNVTKYCLESKMKWIWVDKPEIHGYERMIVDSEPVIYESVTKRIFRRSVIAIMKYIFL